MQVFKIRFIALLIEIWLPFTYYHIIFTLANVSRCYSCITSFLVERSKQRMNNPSGVNPRIPLIEPGELLLFVLETI